MFLALTGEMDSRQRKRAALQSSLVAFGVIVLFAVFGQQILDYLGISLPALQCAGGLLLLLVALQLLTGDEKTPTAGSGGATWRWSARNAVAGGSGAIVATMVLVHRADNTRAVVSVGLGLVLLVHVVPVADPAVSRRSCSGSSATAASPWSPGSPGCCCRPSRCSWWRTRSAPSSWPRLTHAHPRFNPAHPRFIRVPRSSEVSSPPCPSRDHAAADAPWPGRPGRPCESEAMNQLPLEGMPRRLTRRRPPGS